MTSYNGLTIVLDNPSRHDITAKQLLSGEARSFVQRGLQQTFLPFTEITIADKFSCPAPGTKLVMFCGERAYAKFLGPEMSLNESRGTVLPQIFGDDIQCLASYFPQDVLDMQNFEAKYNPEDEDFGSNEEDKDTGGEDVKATKTHGKTRNKNKRFWLLRDLNKANRWLKEGKG